VLLNGVDGRLGARRDYRAGRQAESVALGDLNGDGKLDIAAIVRSRMSGISVFLNRAEGGSGRAADTYSRVLSPSQS
jgi:FG-GAP repeat